MSLFDILHRFVSSNTPGVDGSLVSKDPWNDTHTLVGLSAGTGSPVGVVTALKGAMYVDVAVPELWQNTDGATAWAKVGATPSPWVLGNGVDGALNFDGSATVLGMVPTGTTPKIYTLTRDIFPSSIAVGANVSIDCKNYCIFTNGAIVGANQVTSIIHNGGNPGVGATAGAAKSAGHYVVTIQGGNGVAGTGVGGIGSANGGCPPVPFFATGASGAAGTGSAGASTVGGNGNGIGGAAGGGGCHTTASGQAGATGGAITVTTNPVSPFDLLAGRSASAAGAQWFYGCGGGGGGAVTSAGTNATSGGGGSGGGALFVSAKSIKTCTIHTNGGKGGDAVAGNTTSAAGGGGGGGGGMCVVACNQIGGDVTITATGGAGGAGAQIGAGSTGRNGGTGANGCVVIMGA